LSFIFTVHCQIGSLEISYRPNPLYDYRSLPDRQLRNFGVRFLLVSIGSLPDRQLRNNVVSLALDRSCSLPDRQLRKIIKRKASA